MPRKLYPFPLVIEDWPLPPIETYRAKIQRSRILKDGEKNCLLGNPNFAARLLHWLQDTQEDVYLQIWINYSTAEKKLLSHLCIELDDELSHYALNWEKDIDTLLSINDPKGTWHAAYLPKEKWKSGTILNILEHDEDEPDFQYDLLRDMFQMLQKSDRTTALVLSLRFTWKERVDYSKFENMPKRVRDNKQRRQKWIQKSRLRKPLKPYRQLSRRVTILSDTQITSLLKQSAFRAVAGAGQIYGRWHDLDSRQIKSIAQGPCSSFGFKTLLNLNDRVSIEEIRGSLTANLRITSSPDPHGIPF